MRLLPDRCSLDDLVPLMVAVYQKLTPAQKVRFSPPAGKLTTGNAAQTEQPPLRRRCVRISKFRVVVVSSL